MQTQSLGQLGRLTIILEDGSVVMMVNGRRWILDPLCLIPARGEQPEDEDSEISTAILWLSIGRVLWLQLRLK